MCFYIKRVKKKIKFIGLACTAMYTVFACGEQASFVFMPSPSCTLLLSSDVAHKHKPAFLFCFVLVVSVGPEVFAFSPSVLCVKFVLL